jgi:predicted O-methyltransferase YrrM
MSSTLTRARAAAVAGLKAAYPRRFLQMLVGNGSSIRTYTSAEELILLYEEASTCVRNGVFVEVGSHLGASTVVLAECLRRVSSRRSVPTPVVYCVDTWQNDAMTEGVRDTFAEFTANTAGWTRLIVPLRGYSSDVSLPFDGDCDLVFIDGDHSYEGVKLDVERFSPRVRPGGRCVFHDQDRPGVSRVVGELLVTGRWRVRAALSRMLSLERLE